MRQWLHMTLRTGSQLQALECTHTHTHSTLTRLELFISNPKLVVVRSFPLTGSGTYKVYCGKHAFGSSWWPWWWWFWSIEFSVVTTPTTTTRMLTTMMIIVLCDIVVVRIDSAVWVWENEIRFWHLGFLSSRARWSNYDVDNWFRLERNRIVCAYFQCR